MTAMIATRWGEPSELNDADVPAPEPGPGEVLVGTRAVGRNFADILIVTCPLRGAPEAPRPIASREASGKVILAP